jgi:hypothetical protein
MSNRPPIPAAIRRQVAIESGHRCAADGESGPLEFAHIIPWRRCKRHTPENIICLCANCHQRADLEKWGAKTLRYYKENPWIRRHSAMEENARPGEAVTIRLELRVEDFRDRDSWLLQLAVAGLLRISPEKILVSRLEEGV